MIPAHIINIARYNSQRSYIRINIYLHNDTYVVAPDGYILHDPSSTLLGYVTAAGELIESGQSDEAAKERSATGD